MDKAFEEYARKDSWRWIYLIRSFQSSLRKNVNKLKRMERYSAKWYNTSNRVINPMLWGWALVFVVDTNYIIRRRYIRDEYFKKG